MTNSEERPPASAANVGDRAGVAYDLAVAQDVERAGNDLKRLTLKDPVAADSLYTALIDRAGSNAAHLAAILEIPFTPRARQGLEAMFAAAATVMTTNPVATHTVIACAYRAGRPDVARTLLMNLLSASDDPRVLAQLSIYLLVYETDDAFLVKALSQINANSPYRVGTLIHQAEFASRRQSRAILKKVPPITRAILDYLEPERPIVFLDGGATGSTMEEQFAGWPASSWKVFGFDPHPDADLSVDHAANVQMIRTALGPERGRLHLYHTTSEGGTSGYRPNTEYLKHLKHGSSRSLADLMSVVSESDVEMIDLDSWRRELDIPPFDFIKLNVQGAELDILKGAPETLAGSLGVQCEVSFVPLYLDAPSFRDVDAFLDLAGFTFFDLRKPNTIGRTSKRPTPATGSRAGWFRWPSQQMIEGHVLYLRDPYRPEERDAPRWQQPENWLRLAIIAEMNGQIGFAMQICESVLADFSDALRDRGEAMTRGLDAAGSFYRDFEIINR